MITPLLRHALEPVISRQRNLRYLRIMAYWMAGITGLAIVLFFTREHFRIPAFLLFVLLFLVAYLAGKWANRWEPDYVEIARGIEQRHPELHSLLLTAVEQSPDAHGKLSFLQQQVVQQAMQESRRVPWVDAVPNRAFWGWGSAITLLFVSLVTLSLWTVSAKKQQLAQEEQKAAVAKEPVTVTPGDAEVERGSGLVILATFQTPPSEATLIIQPQNAPAERIPLVKNLDDPVFGGSLPEVTGELTYRVEYAGETTREYKVTVFEHPRLERADVTLRYPDYTKLGEKQIPDTRRISAVEGTRLDVAFQLNKPVKSATLVGKDGSTIPLTVDPAKAALEWRDVQILKSQTYELKLEDADGRANKVPAQLIVDALPNRRPELKFLTPKGDQRLSPLEEVAFKGQAWDDFGLGRYGMTVKVSGGAEQELELGRDGKADERREFAHLLKLEDSGVKPDELISWFIWAEDIGPDGKVRRTASDLFFGEVRPLEEIYKQSDGSEGPSGQGSQAAELAQIQKQVITATWNLQREEQGNTTAQKPSAKYQKDQPVIRDSQAEVLKKAERIALQLDNPKTKAFMEAAMAEMKTAEEHLTKATKDSGALPPALTAEQAAYNALLKLAAHEFQISRNRSQSTASSSQQQRQLEELELKEEEKRYETKKEADPAQTEQQREQLAILNQLKELARRQQDINERLKELQNALQTAKTEPEKEEVRKQLKRLREEEQTMLSDIDELKQKMEQSSQQSQLAEERRQLEETRSEAQKAAEALEKNTPSQALASGTRAAENLQQMRDEFRKKVSGQFNEEMRQMRSDARNLAEKQQELSEKLGEEPSKPQRPTLDGSGEREQLARQFDQQAEGLTKLSEDMKRVSEQAEAAEPLLSRELYDTLRKSAQAGTEESLQKSKLLAENGYQKQAQKFEEKVRSDIEEMKKGVERAAENVLGDEAEAIRQARSELDSLRDQLEQELARARPDLAANDSMPGKDANANQNPSKAQAATSLSEKGDQKAAGQDPAQKPESASKGAGEQGSEKTAQNANQPGNMPGESKQASNEPGQDGKGEGQSPSKGDSAQRQASSGPQSKENGMPNDQAEGQPPGKTPGEQGASPQGQPNSTAQNGNTPGEQKASAQSQANRTAQNGSTPNSSESPANSPANGQANGQSSNASNNPSGENANNPQSRPSLRQIAGNPRERGSRSGNDSRGGNEGGGANREQSGPLTGENFTEWSDRLRNVEEMVDNPQIRAEAARIREIAKGMRVEFKRHSVDPNWELVNTKIRAPLAELRNRLTEELARRESKENLVPIDRDPVPPKYVERVRRYYEDLGRSGQ